MSLKDICTATFQNMTKNVMPLDNETQIIHDSAFLCSAISEYPEKERQLIFKVYNYTPAVIREGDQDYQYTCEILGRNIKKSVLNDIFDHRQYSYDLLERTVKSFYDIGLNFGYYDHMTPIDPFKISDLFVINSGKNKIINMAEKNVSKLTFSASITDKKVNEPSKKKIVKMFTNFYISKNNELHPVIKIFFPYSSSYHFVVFINIASSDYNNQEKILENQKNLFISTLDKHMVSVIKRNLKIKKDEIELMTLDDKIKYMKVIEMSKF